MSANRGRQKQIEKKRKQRALAQRAARARGRIANASASLLRGAGSLPFGPAYMSASWMDDDEGAPGLVTVVMTRKAPNGDFVVGIVLVDRTCLGAKNGFAAVMSPSELDARLGQVAAAHGAAPVETSVLEAQSVIYNAIDFADSLGLEPHEDFPEDVVGPRPEVLLDTPLARPSRPVYIPGPDDGPEVFAALARLRAQGALAEGA